MGTNDKMDVKALLQSYLHYEWRINQDIPQQVRKAKSDYVSFMEMHKNGSNGLTADDATQAYQLKQKAQTLIESIEDRKKALQTVGENIVQLMETLGISQISGMLDVPQGGVTHTKTVTFHRKDDGSLAHT